MKKIITEPLRNTMTWEKEKRKCKNQNCQVEFPSRRYDINNPTLVEIKSFLNSVKEQCPSCKEPFLASVNVTTASPFLIINGDTESKLQDYPQKIAFSSLKGNSWNFDLSYVGI